MPLNALTIDVEDYFQVTAFERNIDRRHWDDYPSRVVANTQRLLDLLAQHGTRATFYILGWVANKFPELVRRIDRAGHEIGSHSYWHRLVYRLSPEEFRQDLLLSRKTLEDVLGRAVTAYRAPSFSITRDSRWALEILAEEGFASDSSVYPIYHDRYGIPDAEPSLHRVCTASGSLWEFPPTVWRRAGVNIPVSGGGYFRLYPVQFTIAALRSVNRESRPFVFYVHPWEVDPKQPTLSAGSRLSRLRHRLNLSATEGKLDRLLGSFRFGTLEQAIAAARFAPGLATV